MRKKTLMGLVPLGFAIYGKNIYIKKKVFYISRLTILSQFFVMLVFLFCKLFEYYSQINFPIIKTAPFKGNNI